MQLYIDSDKYGYDESDTWHSTFTSDTSHKNQPTDFEQMLSLNQVQFLKRLVCKRDCEHKNIFKMPIWRRPVFHCLPFLTTDKLNQGTPNVVPTGTLAPSSTSLGTTELPRKGGGHCKPGLVGFLHSTERDFFHWSLRNIIKRLDFHEPVYGPISPSRFPSSQKEWGRKYSISPPFWVWLHLLDRDCSGSVG